MGRSKNKATAGSALGDRQICKIIDEAIDLASRRIKKQSMPTSVGDLVRLLEVRSALSKPDIPQETIISWRENPSPENLPKERQPENYSLDDLVA
jgi:hypothetical protein